MQELDDTALLREYVERDSEEAFATLVARHVNKIYSVALRHTRNPHQAEEITQAVFVILAKKSRQLPKAVILSGWLCRTAQLTAVTHIRSEIRRASREQEAHMQTLLNETESDAWPQIAPLLDAAMTGLNEMDHHAVVLRFFDGKNMKEIGAALGGSEDAAKKRVNRAVEKMRRFFKKRGVVVPAAVLTAAISANSVQAAPAVLAKTATAVAFAKGATASGSTLTLINGALKVMAWTKARMTIAAGVIAMFAAGTTALVVQHQHPSKPREIASGQLEFPRAAWAFVGYADPQSAVLSTLWAIREGDGAKIADSYTSELQQKLQQMFAKQMQNEGKSFTEILSQETPKHFSQNTGINIVAQKTVPGGQIALRVSVPGERQEHTFFLKKIGSEWKVNDIE